MVENGAANGQTLNSGDAMNGKGGTDTLDILIANNTLQPTFTLDSVENVKVQNLSAGASGVYNAANWTGVQKVQVYNSGQDGVATRAFQVNNLQNNVTAALSNVKVAAAGNDALDMTFASGKVGSATAALNIQTTDSGSTARQADIKITTAGTDKFTTVNIDASGKNYIGVEGGTATSVTLTALNFMGTGSVELSFAAANFASTNIETVDASKNSGGVTVDLSGSTKNINVTGGSGNDEFRVDLSRKVTVNAGAGNDVVNIQGAVLADLTTDDTLNGGEGYNTLAMNSADAAALAGATAANLARITNFDAVRTLNDLGGNHFNISKFDNANELQIGAATGTLTNVTGFTDNATVQYRAAANSTAFVNIGITGATNPGTNDTLNIALNSNLGANNGFQALFGVDGIENLKVTTADRDNTDGATSATDGTGYGLRLQNDNRVENIMVTGDRAFSYTASNTAARIDTVDFSGLESRGVVNLAGYTATQGAEVTAGTKGSYVLGTGENDKLIGGAEANVLLGGAGKDTLVGGAKNDYLDGGAGSDTMTGNGGNNTFAVSTVTTASAAGMVMDTITDLNFSNDTIANLTQNAPTISNKLTEDYDGYTTLFDALNDEVAAAIGANKAGLFNYKGEKYLFINDGTAGLGVDDTIIKVTNYTGTLAAANLSNTAGATIIGTAADDTLVGTAFNDTITGGAGNDTITGGNGIDTIDISGGGSNQINLNGITLNADRSEITGFDMGALAGGGDILNLFNGTGYAAGAKSVKILANLTTNFAANDDIVVFNANVAGAATARTPAELAGLFNNNVAALAANQVVYLVLTTNAAASADALIHRAVANGAGTAFAANSVIVGSLAGIVDPNDFVADNFM